MGLESSEVPGVWRLLPKVKPARESNKLATSPPPKFHHINAYNFLSPLLPTQFPHPAYLLHFNNYLHTKPDLLVPYHAEQTRAATDPSYIYRKMTQQSSSAKPIVNIHQRDPNTPPPSPPGPQSTQPPTVTPPTKVQGNGGQTIAVYNYNDAHKYEAPNDG